MDNDQFFKEMVEYNLADLVEHVFPAWRDRFEYDRVEWLREQLHPNPPQGEVQRIDLLAKLPTRPSNPPRPNEPESSLVLIHIEIEGRDPLHVFDQRMCEYYLTLRNKNLAGTILPLVVFFHVQAGGRGTRHVVEELWEQTTFRFSYNYIALPGLTAADHLHGNNLLAVAWTCFMQMPHEQRPLAAADAMERIATSALPERNKYIMVDFVQSYGPVDDDQRRDLNELLKDPKRERAMFLEKTIGQKAIENAVENARQNALLDIAFRQVTSKFANAKADAVRVQLASLGPAELDSVLLKILTANTLGELGLRE